MAITVGKKAPAFNLPSSLGDKVRLSSLLGQIVVVYFYPKNNTPGCTTQAIEFQSLLRKFKNRDVVILGVSKDTIESHCGFSEKHGLKFALLSDESTKMMVKYEAWGEKNMYGRKSMGIIRSTVVIGTDGKVKNHWKRVRAKGHAAKVLEFVDELQAQDE